jgi:hypothetical protein
MEQLDMFGGAPPPRRQVPEAKPSPDELFADFLHRHGAICARALDLARGKVAAGERRIGVAALWEELRGKVGIALNNSCRAPLARWLVEQDRALDGAIEMRRRPSAAPARRRRSR